jgi:hypothetical protein
MPTRARLVSRLSRGAPLVGIPFAFGAIHHVLAIASPSAQDQSSATRHLVFVGINLFFGAAFASRTRWILFPALLLAGQQIYSHGGGFLEARRAGVFDGESFAVLCFLPLVLVTALALRRTGADVTAA